MSLLFAKRCCHTEPFRLSVWQNVLEWTCVMALLCPLGERGGFQVTSLFMCSAAVPLFHLGCKMWYVLTSKDAMIVFQGSVAAAMHAHGVYQELPIAVSQDERYQALHDESTVHRGPLCQAWSLRPTCLDSKVTYTE